MWVCGGTTRRSAAAGFTRLLAPLRRIAGFDTPFPYAFEDHYLPNKERVLDVLKKTIEF